MDGDPTSVDTIIGIQGDKVDVRCHRDNGAVDDYVMTFVHVADHGARQLRLINREAKDHLPDWKVGPGMLAAVKPALNKDTGATWRVSLKL
jgi:hypothetical protein